MGAPSLPPVFGVFELAQAIKQMVESAISGVWVEGEVTQLKRAPSGHVYFTLKDERRDALLDAVMYRREALAFGRFLVEGGRVQVRGKASFYVPRGRLQLVADRARPEGRGSLLEALEALKRRLVEEKVIDPTRRRALPSDPRVIGVVTSEHGAAFSDIVAVATRRGRARIVLAPAVVQGEEAPSSLLSALDLIERLPGLDAVIVGRGGGSQEDLSAFNDERVVRRVARMRVPVVSAVGHEIDTALTDLVADVRAATPSEAAELLVPDSRERKERLARSARQLVQALRVHILRLRRMRGLFERRLKDPRFLLSERQQELDELRLRLERCRHRLVKAPRARLLELAARLESRHPRAVVLRVRGSLGPLAQKLRSEGRLLIASRRARLRAEQAALGALSPIAILERGYAIATDVGGVAIRDPLTQKPGARVTVRVARGSFSALVAGDSAAVESGPDFEHLSPAGVPAGGDDT